MPPDFSIFARRILKSAKKHRKKSPHFYDTPLHSIKCGRFRERFSILLRALPHAPQTCQTRPMQPLQPHHSAFSLLRLLRRGISGKCVALRQLFATGTVVGSHGDYRALQRTAFYVNSSLQISKSIPARPHLSAPFVFGDSRSAPQPPITFARCHSSRAVASCSAMATRV